MKDTKIIIAGDMLPMPCNYDLFAEGDTEALFGQKICELFASADVRICNLEGCFSDSSEPIEKIGPSIKAPTETIRAVKELGIDWATLGNTHSMDYGYQGYLDTCLTLTENGIGYIGWGRTPNPSEVTPKYGTTAGGSSSITRRRGSRMRLERIIPA